MLHGTGGGRAPAAITAETGPALEFCDAFAPLGGTDAQKEAITRLQGMFSAWLASARLPCAFHTYVSGSFRLNVHTRHADLDVVFVVPAGVSRDAVMTGFYAYLRQQDGVEDVLALTGARVPLLSAVIGDQDFDIMTVHLRTSDLPSVNDALWSYEWMNGLDEASVLSFNGPRVTELLLRDYCRRDGARRIGLALHAFQTATRIIRLWAQQRCVYGNKAGFLGGVNCALLVAWAADALSSAPTSRAPIYAMDLVRYVFATLNTWVFRTPLVLQRHTAGACPVWLQVYDQPPKEGDGSALHISTPCFPRFNTTYTASAYTLRVLRAEIAVAARALRVGTHPLHALCQPLLPALVEQCARYLRVRVVAPQSDAGKLWQGFVEAQARHLVTYLEKEELGIGNFRSLPHWVSECDAAARAMYIAADRDGVTRMYVLRGNLQRPLEHFLQAHTGPPKPAGCSVMVEYVDAAAVPKAELCKGVVDVPLPVEATADEAPLTCTTPAPRRRAPVPPLQTFGIPPLMPTPAPAPSRLRIAAAIAAPPQATWVRLRRCKGVMVQDAQFYVGPAVTLRGGVRLKPVHDALAPPRNLSTFLDRVQVAAARDASLHNLLSAMRSGTVGCWCVDATTCHAAVLTQWLNSCPPVLRHKHHGHARRQSVVGPGSGASSRRFGGSG